MTEPKTVTIEEAFEITIRLFKDVQKENADLKLKVEILNKALGDIITSNSNYFIDTIIIKARGKIKELK